MQNPNIEKFADALYNAAKTCVAVPPLTESDGTLTVDDAYAIQLRNVKRVVAEGHVVSGKKIGLTSEGIQKQMGVSEPDYGHLFQAMDYADGNIPFDQFLQPKIEGEIAFVLKKDLYGGKVTRQDVIDATEYVVPAFEIVDSRIADWKIKLVDTISDNASSGCYVLGETKRPLDEVDLPNISMQHYKNGELVQQGTGRAVLGDPCLSVAWLANRLWSYGVMLKEGEVILSGAFSAAPVASKGDVFEARFSDFGIVQARFV